MSVLKRTDVTAGLACICVVLSGCATPYQSNRFTGGFSETQLSSNVFKVYFSGNGYTSDERAADFTLMRSAELAYTHGFAYFIIVDEQSGASYSTVTTPTTTYTTTNVTGTGGDTAYGTSTSTTVGGETYVIRKPAKQNTIICFNEKPPVQGVAYESQYVVQSIRAKYGMKPETTAATNPAPSVTQVIDSANWVPYSSNALGELIDFESIKGSGNTRRAWFKSTSASPTMKSLPPQLSTGVDYVLALNEFNCDDRELRILSLYFHGVDTALSSPLTPEWEPVKPDSTAEAAMHYLCNITL
jgi:hypothetical protein